MKYKDRKNFFGGVFNFIVMTVIVGFIVVVAVLINERLRFSNTLTLVANNTDVEEIYKNLSTLLEAYNKSNTTEILSLLYTVLATIAFSYGIIVFNKVQEEAKATRNDLAIIQEKENHILNQAYFSSFRDRIHTALCIAVGLATLSSRQRSVCLSQLMQQLQDCESKFPVSEIARKNVVEAFLRETLSSTMEMLQETLLVVQASVDINTTGVSEEAIKNDKKALQISLEFSDKYIEAINKLEMI